MPETILKEFLRIPRQDKLVTGIDVGTRMVKAVTVRRTRAGSCRIESWTAEEIPVGPKDTLQERKIATLRHVLVHYRGSMGWVVVSLPREITSIRTINLPAVDPNEIAEMVRFDAERHIPFPIDQVEIAYKVVWQHENHTSDVMLVAARRQDLDAHLTMLQEAGLDPDFLSVSVSGCARVFSLQGSENGCVGVLDLGERRSDLAVSRANHLVFSRALHAGAERLYAIAEKIEREKMGDNSGLHRPPVSTKWSFSAVGNLEGKPEGLWIDELTAELQRTIQSYKYEVPGGDLEKIILCGGLANLPGIEERIEERLHVETLAAEDVIPDNVDARKSGPLPPEMTAALGTALEIALDGRPSINLLPQQIVEQRKSRRRNEFRKQTATFVVMIAFLLTGLAYTQTKTLMKKLDLVDKQISNLDKTISEVEILQNELDTMNALRDTKRSAFQILKTVYELTPDTIQIRSMSFTKQDMLVMECRAKTDLEARQYVEELIKAPLFDPQRIDLGQTSPESMFGGTSKVIVQHFKVSLGLRVDEQPKKETTKKGSKKR